MESSLPSKLQNFLHRKKNLFFNSLVFLCLSHFDFFSSLYFLRSFAVGALISSSFHFSAGAVSLKKSIKQKYTSFFVSSAAFRFQFFFFFFEKFVQFLLRQWILQFFLLILNYKLYYPGLSGSLNTSKESRSSPR